MNNAQLELELVQTRNEPFQPARRNRHSRASWWFGQMRRVVDTAMEWAPAGSPRPEQILIPGTHREIQFSPR